MSKRPKGRRLEPAAEEDYGGPKGPKCGDIKPAPQRLLSGSEAKALARLVRKHGREAIATAARDVPLPRRPGRPSRGDLPYYERMDLAEWIEEQAAEHERNHLSAPYKRAFNDVYEMMYGDDLGRPDPG